jgi:serine/threonine protein kinase
MLKAVREVYPTQTFWPVELRPQLQEVTHRPEAWARNRHLQHSQQISTNTYRVLERFTGKVETAKFFRHGENSHELRHTEFLKFGKTKLDASLVRYLQSVEINHIPAVITETYEYFEPYAALEEIIKKQHPRVRFTIASKLLRRLFSALAFLHFHKIIHANVTKKGILLRLVDFKPEAVLLVDYSDSTSFTVGAPEPHKNMIEDGRATMEIVESCCDIWQLRKAATKDASSEEFMATKTEAARKDFALMERVVADFFGPKGESRESKKGKKMLRLLEHKENSWHIARDSQIHNATRREVGPCRSQTIQEMEHDWTSMHPPPKIGEEQHMLLTLGHPYLDGLASKLYHNRWDLPPRDVCAKIEQLAGSIEEPWQTFSLKKTVSFTQDSSGFEERCILDWLASCCEAYPEWRCAFVKECERHIVPQHGIIKFADIKMLQDALTEQGSLPEFMQVTFARLTDAAIKNQPTTQLEETHQVWYHKPSRMFNLTQLHRLANPDRFLACIKEGSLACDNFVEVRGEPKIEGLYASLSLLAASVHSLN